jgi:hypothetical protein
MRAAINYLKQQGFELPYLHNGRGCVSCVPARKSLLNQIEIYFSILQRKLLTPNDVKSLKDLEQHLMDFQNYYEQIAVGWVNQRRFQLREIWITGWPLCVGIGGRLPPESVAAFVRNTHLN